ncbi:hypothetical protein Tco_0493897 [Tanacetum coccineum]
MVLAKPTQNTLRFEENSGQSFNSEGGVEKYVERPLNSTTQLSDTGSRLGKEINTMYGEGCALSWDFWGLHCDWGGDKRDEHGIKGLFTINQEETGISCSNILSFLMTDMQREAVSGSLESYRVTHISISFLKQKAKVEWLMVGDSNSAYFHNFVKRRNHRSQIRLVKDCNGIEFEGAAVPYTFVSHFEQFLGVEGSYIHLLTEGLFGTRLDESKAEGMAGLVTNEEIKSEIFSIGDNYSSGPDGFSASFFKHAWDIISEHMCLAMKDFS